MKRLSGAVLTLSLCAAACAAGAAEPLIVHEWGTFTSYQNPQGETLYGRAVNNAPVPAFVHHVGDDKPVQPGGPLTKGAVPIAHPDVSMRLETPVLYFYPPKTAKLPLEIDVKATMNGGWLTEFYPTAQANITPEDVKIGKHLTKDFVGSLEWKNLQVGGKWVGPKTQDTVWLMPRKVKSAPVKMPSGESEQYLFYRGVANADAPLKFVRKDGRISGSYLASEDLPQSPAFRNVWLVNVTPAGKMAWRRLPGINLPDAKAMKGAAAATFDNGAYVPGNLIRLKADMHAELVKAGLFKDEAAAMLTTWEKSYFKTPGLRVFYLVPRIWVDRQLPLKISVPAKTTRVMMGRIELLGDSPSVSGLRR